MLQLLIVLVLLPVRTIGLFQNNVNSGQHLASEECKGFAEKRRKRMQEIIQQSAENVDFYVTGEKIKRAKQFKYLGRILSDDDDEIHAVEGQLKKARMAWGRIGKVIKKRIKSNPKIMSTAYKVIVQSVLSYGSESWTVNKKIMKKLTSFHRRCARISPRRLKVLCTCCEPFDIFSSNTPSSMYSI